MWHPLFASSERWRKVLIRAARHRRLDNPEDLASEVILAYLARWKRGPTNKFRELLDAVFGDLQKDRLHASCRWDLGDKARKCCRRREIADHDELRRRQTRSAPAAECEAKDLLQAFLAEATPNEREVVALLILGNDVREISRALRRPERTVYSWCERVRTRANRHGMLTSAASG